MIFDYPALLSYYYYPDQTARPNLYVYGGTYWGLTNTSSWEHAEHTGRDYVSWATYRVNYQLFLNDGTESNTPWKMNKVRLQLKSPRSGTQIRVNGFSDNINLAVQGTTDSYTTLTVDVHPVDTLFIPQDSNTRFSFWIDFTVMFNPSIDIEELYNLSGTDSPVQPVMDASGFQPQLVSYVPADSMGGSSAAGQQQIDQSVNAQGNKIDSSITEQTQQQEQQYNEFTESGDSSLFDDTFDEVHEKVGLITALEDIGTSIFDFFLNFDGSGYPILVFPAFSIDVDGITYDVWGEYEFDLGEFFGSGPMYFLIETVQFTSVVVVYSQLLRYLIRVWEKIMGNEYIRGGDYF